MARLVSQHIELPDDYDAVQNLYLERGWSDGLPITPPTPERVEAMLSAVSQDPQRVVAQVPPNWGDATVERLAINSVMAGCLPEYLPVIIAGVAAMSVPAFNLYAIQATTHSCAPLFIVNGPIRERLGLNGSSGAYGPGLAGQCHHRPGGAAGPAEHRRRPPRRGRHVHPGRALQVHLLRRRKRGS